jgi:hypothetical protein
MRKVYTYIVYFYSTNAGAVHFDLLKKWKMGGRGGSGGDLVLSNGVANEEAVSWASTNQEA